MEKKLNKIGAAGWRTTGEDEEMSDIGPTYFMTVDPNSTPEEMEEYLEVLMALPKEVIGSAVVFREGVNLVRLDDNGI